MLFAPDLVMRTTNPRLVSVGLAAFEKAPDVRGTYRDTGTPAKQLVSLEASVQPGANNVAYGIAFSETANTATVRIGGYPNPLKVRAYNLQEICESSLRTGKPLYEVSAQGDELRRAKVNANALRLLGRTNLGGTVIREPMP